MKNPKISIIVPLYNAEKYVDRCIQSIYSQTFKDYEIILVNDGSTDNSAEICRKYAESDRRITFIDKENGGAGSARNAGIEAAKGEYLAFPDVDDWFEPQMYDELYTVAKSGNYDIVFSGVNYYKTSKEGKLTFSRTVNCDNIAFNSAKELRENVMTFFPTSTIFDVPWNKLYKKSVAVEKNVRFSDTRRCQDAMFNIDFYGAANSAIGVSKAYYNYIENDAAGVNRKFPKNYIDIIIIYFDRLISILKSWGVYSGDIKQHYDTSFVISVYGNMGAFDNPLWNLTKAQKKEYVLNIMNRTEIKEMLKDADIREDAAEQYRILKENDYRAFMKHYKREKLKEKIRQNKVIINLYRSLRGTK